METIENNKNYRNSKSLLTIWQLWRYVVILKIAILHKKNVRQVMQLVCIFKFIFVGHLKQILG